MSGVGLVTLLPRPPDFVGESNGIPKLNVFPPPVGVKGRGETAGKTRKTKEVKVVRPQMVLGARVSLACVQHAGGKGQLIVLYAPGTSLPTILGRLVGKMSKPSKVLWPKQVATTGSLPPVHTCAHSQEEAMRSPGDGGTPPGNRREM